MIKLTFYPKLQVNFLSTVALYLNANISFFKVWSLMAGISFKLTKRMLSSLTMHQ